MTVERRPERLRALAAWHLGREEHAAARASFESALALEPEHPAAVLGLAVLHLNRGELDSARALCRRVTARDPCHPEAQLLLGLAHPRLRLGAVDARDHFARPHRLAFALAQALHLAGGVLHL